MIKLHIIKANSFSTNYRSEKIYSGNLRLSSQQASLESGKATPLDIKVTMKVGLDDSQISEFLTPSGDAPPDLKILLHNSNEDAIGYDIFADEYYFSAIEEFQKKYLLSYCEMKVLSQVVTGLSNSEIAVKLFNSEFTIKNHVSKILEKLDVPNRLLIIKKFINEIKN